MKKRAIKTGLVVCCSMLIVSGCAKQGVVKSDDSMALKTLAADQSKNEQLKAEELKNAQLKTEQLKSERLKAEALKAASMKPSSSQSTQPGQTLNAGSETMVPILNASELKAALEVIYFDFDSYALSQNARNALVQNANLMKKDPSIKIRVEGNCDERGSDEYNLALGEKRAKAAMQYIVTMGVPEKRLSVISYGKEKPFAVGHDETSWAKNRRDEFVIAAK